MKKIILMMSFLLFMACSEPLGISLKEQLATIGHEVAHCLLGQWHENDGTLPTEIDWSKAKKSRNIVFITIENDAELQRLYNEARGKRSTFPIHGFNIDITGGDCTVYFGI